MKQLQLIFVMIALLLSFAVSPCYAYDFRVGNIMYSILSTTQKTVSVVGGTTGNIPSTVTYDGKEYTVTEIGRFAFNESTISSFSLPESLKAIRENAFGFTKAKRIVIPDNVEELGEDVFWYSSVQTIIVGSGVKKIESGAFYGCSNLKLLVFKSATPATHESRGYSIGTTTTEVLVPQKSAYEKTSLTKVIHGTIIEPITFKTHQYTYSGEVPTISYTNNIDIDVKSTRHNIKVNKIDAGNYQDSFSVYCTDAKTNLEIPYNYTINKVSLNIDIKDVQREYGESNPTLSDYTISGFVNNETEDVLSTSIILSTDANIQSSVGQYPITCSPNAKNYDFVINNGVLTITAAPLTVKVEDVSREYGIENSTFTCKYTGLKNNDVPVLTSEFVFETASSKADIGTYPINVRGGNVKNYEITEYQSGTLTITKAPLTLVVNNTTKVYGRENPVFDFTLVGLRNGDDKTCLETRPTYTCAANSSSECGEYDIMPSGAQAKNYEISYQNGKLSVTQAALKLIAVNASREYGDANPVLKYEVSGLKGDDSALTVLDEEPVLTTKAVESSTVGEYAITISGGTSKNYTLSYKSGILTITKAPLTVSAANAERMYGENNPTFSRSYLGFKLTDTESSAFSSLPKLCCAATKTSSVGEYSITVSGGTSKNYEITEYENGVLTVNRAPLVLTANNKNRLYFEDNPTFDFTVSGLRNNDTKSSITKLPTYTCSASKTSNAGTYDITPSDAVSTNYSIEYKSGILSINQRSLTASVGSYTKVYGTNNPEFEVNYSGFVNNENKSVLSNMATAVCSADETSDVGTYTISVSGGDATNYVISTYKSGTLTISKADQTLTWKQNLSNIEQYAQVALEATSSAGLDVTYEMSPNNVATLYQIGSTWYLDCYGYGVVNIRAIQNGDSNHNAATVLTKTLFVSTSGSGTTDPQIYLNVETAGTLSSLIAENKKYQIKNIRLTGYLNGSDIKYLREMAGSDVNGNTTTGILETLDISGCTIVSGGSSYYSSYKTSNDVIGSNMFYNCKTLVNLMLPDNTKAIGICALADCDRLSAISIPEGVTSFGDKSFRNDISLTRIPIPSKLTSVGDMAFMGCNGVTMITLPASVMSLGDGIVKDCPNISSINVEKGNRFFASHNGVLYTGSYDKLLIFPANYGTSSYTVLDGTTRIEDYAFASAEKLTDVILPSSLLTIGNDAFSGCVNLASLQVNAITPPTCDNDCFEAVSKTKCELRVPKVCYSNYWVAPVWSEFNKIIEIDITGITSTYSDGIKVYFDGIHIVVSGVPNNMPIRIYQMDGMLISQTLSDGNNIYYHPTSSGVYIVAIGKKIIKLSIKP